MAGSNVLKFGAHLKELRLHLCQKSIHSKGVRDFIEKFYVPVKKNNPGFPILIRESSGVQPKIYARYEQGKETSVSLADMNSNQVFQTLEKLSTK